MASVGLVRDQRFRRHLAPSHPEQPARLDFVDQALEESGLLSRTAEINAMPAMHEDILRAHVQKVVDTVEATRGKAIGFIDPDTYFCGDSAETALLSAGGVMAAAEAVVVGDVERSLALVRPPGHHATRLRSMGFCLYNNIAVATRYIQDKYPVQRVAIIDFDVHHGNGTQDIFYEDAGVFYYSIHQEGIFPGTGRSEETGRGAAEGTNLNIPVDSGILRWEWMKAFEKGLDKVFAFDPQLVMLSAGFDAHNRDPLASMGLESEDFYKLTRAIVDRTRGRKIYGIVSALEGGYNLAALGESVVQHLKALLED